MVPTEQAQREAPLFLVRLWNEEDGAVEPPTSESHWRGKVLHMSTGQAHYFTTWASLVAFLDSIFPGPDGQKTNDE